MSDTQNLPSKSKSARRINMGSVALKTAQYVAMAFVLAIFCIYFPFESVKFAYREL